MDDDSELRNPFPSPPSHYVRYSDRNLKLLNQLRDQPNDLPPKTSQHEVLSGERDIPDWPLDELEKPRLDWIIQDGEYNVFGDLWQTSECTPSLAELGGTQLFSKNPSIDHRSALHTILYSLLLSYSSMLKSLLLPPPSVHFHGDHDWNRHMHWITVLCQNITAAANDLRPVQARVNLETMVRHQLELRRSETRIMQKKCDSLENTFAKLQTLASSLSGTSTSLELKPNKVNQPECMIELHGLLGLVAGLGSIA